MEEALAAQDELSYTIVRPTAFFKSVSGQVRILPDLTLPLPHLRDHQKCAWHFLVVSFPGF